MITVFTPTYNRHDTLCTLYESLLRQSIYDFEWLIVDDGSTDNTKELIESFIASSNPFKIRYMHQENGGKHRAINTGVKYARGSLFFIVDSDDYLIDTAIEKILSWTKELSPDQQWAGVSGSKGISTTVRIGGALKGIQFIDAKNIERKKYNLTGDRAEVYYTHILKEYPFPVFENEKFITEEVVWNRIALDGYQVRWFNEIIYICEYREDGLTNDKMKFERNPLGTLEWARGQLEAYPNDIREKIRAEGIYYFAVKKRKKVSEIAMELGIPLHELYISASLYKIYCLLKNKKLFIKAKV